MLNIKEINKIKDMYYEKHYSVTFISRSMKISKSTLYKYLKSYNFSPGITIKHNSKNKSLPYKDIVVSFLEVYRKHHLKQRHTDRRAYNRLKEEFSDFDALFIGIYPILSRTQAGVLSATQWIFTSISLSRRMPSGLG